jgi:hypothetical protein
MSKRKQTVMSFTISDSPSVDAFDAMHFYYLAMQQSCLGPDPGQMQYDPDARTMQRVSYRSGSKCAGLPPGQ